MGSNQEQEQEQESLLSKSENSKKGGVKTLPFIIVNESCERLASLGLTPNMIIYLVTFYHMEAATASELLGIWSALSNGLALVGAFISDSYLGRFRALVVGSIFSLMGTTVLWLTTIIPQLRPSPCSEYQHDCNGTTAAQLTVLLCSFGFISVGAGFIRPCSLALGADQLYSKENPDSERVLDSFYNWFFASVGVSTFLAVTLLVYIQDQFGWQVGFSVPAMLMFLALSIFLIGSPLYIKKRARGSLFTGLFQVAVAAFRKRHINIQLNDNGDCYYRSPESKLLAPSTDFRCLNRACLIQDPHGELKPDGTASNPWSLCCVEQVEKFKCFLRALPMWSAFIMYLVAIGQSSFLIFQAKAMDRHMFPGFEIPAGSVGMFSIIAMTIWIAFYDRVMVPLLSRYTGQPMGLSPVFKMAIGLIVSCAAMALSAITETIRRNKAIDAGFEDDPTGVINMSIMWFIPQFTLSGIGEALNVVGQIEYIMTLFPKSMSSFSAAIYTVGVSVAALIGSLLVSIVDSVTSAGGNTSWLSSNINKGHLDYFYWLLTFLCIINYLYFLLVCRFCEHYQDSRGSLLLEVEEEQSQSRRFHGA